MKSKSTAKKELELFTRASKIRAPKFKRNEAKDSLWWEKHLEELEKEHRTPDYCTLNYLQTIYTDKEIKDIANSGIKIKKDINCHRDSQDFVQLKKKSLSTTRKSKSAPSQPTHYSNPYMDFMNKSKKEARSWYPKSDPKLEELPIIERAERVKSKIVTNFVENFKATGKSEEINEQTLLSMYEMTCPFPICSALRSKNEICGTVPETTAKHLGCYEQSDHNKLINHILKDIRASERRPKKTAFGTSLPPELRRERFKGNPGTKWVEQNADHKNIGTFAEVWKNITDLESTRQFCLYLLDHPEVIPPAFLVREGMMIKNILKKPVYLGILEKQFENQDTADLMDITNTLQKINNTMEDFTRRLTKAPENSATSVSVGEISDVNIMV